MAERYAIYQGIRVAMNNIFKTYRNSIFIKDHLTCKHIIAAEIIPTIPDTIPDIRSKIA
jgi:hypothetical protein